jgi:hypothetical protein
MMFERGYFFEMMWDDAADFVFENGSVPEDCIAGLHLNAREKLCELIEREWKNQEWKNQEEDNEID